MNFAELSLFHSLQVLKCYFLRVKNIKTIERDYKIKARNYKTPRGKHRQNTLWHKSQQDPLWPTSQNIGNKSKNKQMGPNETYKLLHNKGNYKQGEKTALRLGENNSKRSNRQRINLKNIQATPPAQLQKNKWPNQKMSQRTKQTFLQRRHTDG